ncbi:MAG: hypothetical protein EON93_00935 [Burkholderiales bacterium]|nr:MAG: hypothetical protein EON93_00935 [Burkholderiales bacterium]
MASKLIAAVASLVLLGSAAPAFGQPTTDAKLRFLGSTQWDCDDRIAFDGGEGGLHDTVSLLRMTFDEDLRDFEGIFRTSLSYGTGLYSQEYKISGYAFDEDGKQGIMIDAFRLTERATLPSDIGWRDMARMIYYIRLEGDAMGLDGVWEDTAGGRGRSECG